MQTIVCADPEVALAVLRYAVYMIICDGAGNRKIFSELVTSFALSISNICIKLSQSINQSI